MQIIMQVINECSRYLYCNSQKDLYDGISIRVFFFFLMYDSIGFCDL